METITIMEIMCSYFHHGRQFQCGFSLTCQHIIDDFSKREDWATKKCFTMMFCNLNFAVY